jgi:hypothetical protein
MKKYIKLLLFLFPLTLLLSACSFNSPDMSQKGSNFDDSEYYVQYSLKSTHPYYQFSDIYYATEHGTECAKKGEYVKSWTVIVGPVKGGFRAFVRCQGSGTEAKIEVSKNGSPFALKASGEVSVSYTIDY